MTQTLFTDTRQIVRKARRRAFFYSALPWVATVALVALYAILDRLTG